MGRTPTKPESLSIGQLAKRWGVAPERIRSLIESGVLPNVFEIPSSGRYGTTVRIPWASVLEAEHLWQLAPSVASRPRPPQRSVLANGSLRHLGDLLSPTAPGGRESPAGEQY